jgi:putative OPT family oligopeptide transporter
MAEAKNPTGPPKHKPYVPADMKMSEFTLRAIILGLLMTVILGAANAYLGLRAGMTIAATYPAAVIGMSLLRLMRGSLLEENMARTIGSIGESVAAGAAFTIPGFVLAGLWPGLGMDKFWQSTALMVIGGLLGILFVTLLRRVMVEDTELPFPESVAASEIHKAGQRGSTAAKILFANMGFGAVINALGQFNIFAPVKTFTIHIGEIGRSLLLRTSLNPNVTRVTTGGVSTFNSPAISPAYMGVGYIIGPRLAALNFAGGLLAWGLLVPLLTYMLGPELRTRVQETLPPNAPVDWGALSGAVYFSIVRPIAVGGMLVGAGYTLFRMRKQLGVGMARAIKDLRKSAETHRATERHEIDLNIKAVFFGVALVFVAMIGLYYFFISGAGNLSSGTVVAGAIGAAVVMIILGFFFAAVSGNLVGMIGSSNNPVSGLTLCTLVVAALLMVGLGVAGVGGVAAVLGVAAVVCVSSAVAGEMLQDLFFVLMLLDNAYHFGSAQLAAPQAGLMAMLARGIVGGDMAWPLVVVGILMGFALIMVQVRSPMLFSVGMYLPVETTFAIFVGGVIRWATDKLRDRRNLNEAQKARVENAGVLTASGLIAGEALCGLVIAGIYRGVPPPVLESPHWIGMIVAAAALIFVMIKVPLANAGSPDEPAPPTAIM